MFYIVVDGFRGSRKSYPTIELARARAYERYKEFGGSRTTRVVQVIEEIPQSEEIPPSAGSQAVAIRGVQVVIKRKKILSPRDGAHPHHQT